MSSTSPLARTTVRARIHCRVVPYLNVAAPAALVATVPPRNAPRKVGAIVARCREPGIRTGERDAFLTRADPVRTSGCDRSGAADERFAHVAPPVSDDCDPIGSTAEHDRRTSTTSASVAGA
jgi:hypothetical protein